MTLTNAGGCPCCPWCMILDGLDGLPCHSRLGWTRSFWFGVPKVARTWALYAATRSQWPVYVGSPCMLRKVTAFHCLPPAPRMRQSEFGCLGSTEDLFTFKWATYIIRIYIYTHTQIIKTYIYIYSLYIYFFFRVGDPENYGKATHVRWPIGYISPGHVRGRVLAQPHVSLAAGDADPLVRRAAGHRRCGLQRWKGLRHQGMEPKGWSHAEPWWLLVSRASFRVSHGIGGKWLSWSGMPNSWKFSYPAQETASDKVSRSDWCDTVGSVLLEFQADEGKQDETSTGSWKERSCFIESWLLNIESMAWFKGKSSVNPFFEWFVHMCTIRYRVFPFPVSLKPTQWLKAHSPKEWVEGPRSLGKHLGPEHGLCDSFGALLPWAREV